MKSYKKFPHIGYAYAAVPDSWVPIVEKAIAQIEKVMWPRWMPMFLKRKIHYWATGNSIIRVRSRFWYKVRDYLTGNQIITDIKSKYAQLRIYGFFGNEIEYIIEKAEKECERTCEMCGHQGDDVKISGQGWYYNLCDKCFREQ